MRAFALLALALLPALTGCADLLPRSACSDGYPLVLQEDLRPADAVARMSTYAWNCTDRPNTFVETCVPGFALYPRLVLDEVTYVVGLAPHAVTEGDAPCTGVPQEGPRTLEPGTTVSVAGYTWDGRVLRPGGEAPERVPGEHLLEVELGAWYASLLVEVPA